MPKTRRGNTRREGAQALAGKRLLSEDVADSVNFD